MRSASSAAAVLCIAALYVDRACMGPAYGACKRMQITMYENAWPLLADGGVYICEDTSTSMVRAGNTNEAWAFIPLGCLRLSVPAL
jgi:hypothetical protein